MQDPMTMTDRQLHREAVLELLRAAAREGRRCPTNAELRRDLRRRGYTLPQRNMPSALAEAGHCRVEVYAKNWRVIEIDGMRTAPPRVGSGEPYKVFEAPVAS